MRVVIVGSRNRNESVDTPLVYKIIDKSKEKYSQLIVVVTSCDKGVGRIVKTRNMKLQMEDPIKNKGKYEFPMVELQMRHYLEQELPRIEFTSHWNALNAAAFEMGDAFHLLIEDYPKGAMGDLLKRIKEAGRPYALYKTSETSGEAKECVIDTTNDISLKETPENN